ncbi:hypothetical protein [Mastigocladopsis repens]|uniref:hypothetical protein n=1 Tax=Mastigocladopsis repens TaxID=221287 RepID=UPI000364C096|nr:hypothetical protein [Mastigocladopsis repens]
MVTKSWFQEWLNGQKTLCLWQSSLSLPNTIAFYNISLIAPDHLSHQMRIAIRAVRSLAIASHENDRFLEVFAPVVKVF